MNKNVPLTSDQMALERTIMASERTFMAWSRTALSFISFGFAIPKVLEQLQPNKRLLGDHGPRIFGITMILLGVFILAFTSFHHRRMVKRMKLDQPQSFSSTSISTVVAIVLLIIGLFAILNLLMNIGPF